HSAKDSESAGAGRSGGFWTTTFLLRLLRGSYPGCPAAPGLRSRRCSEIARAVRFTKQVFLIQSPHASPHCTRVFEALRHRVQWIAYLNRELYFIPESGEAAAEIR